MHFESYRIVSYRQDDGSWVAEIASLPGCYALMTTRDEALLELQNVFRMIAGEQEFQQLR
jgi:predicted RNase H-like HicB family nuclease